MSSATAMATLNSPVTFLRKAISLASSELSLGKGSLSRQLTIFSVNRLDQIAEHDRHHDPHDHRSE